VPVVVEDHVVPCASVLLTATQTGDSAMAGSLPLVPGYLHNTEKSGKVENMLKGFSLR